MRQIVIVKGEDVEDQPEVVVDFIFLIATDFDFWLSLRFNRLPEFVFSKVALKYLLFSSFVSSDRNVRSQLEFSSSVLSTLLRDVDRPRSEL